MLGKSRLIGRVKKGLLLSARGSAVAVVRGYSRRAVYLRTRSRRWLVDAHYVTDVAGEESIIWGPLAWSLFL
jgi:hypothetical protein